MKREVKVKSIQVSQQDLLFSNIDNFHTKYFYQRTVKVELQKMYFNWGQAAKQTMVKEITLYHIIVLKILRLLASTHNIFR